MSDQPLHPVVGMHKSEIIIAIEAAPVAELREIDAALAAIGYAPTGVFRSRIAERLTSSPE